MGKLPKRGRGGAEPTRGERSVAMQCALVAAQNWERVLKFHFDSKAKEKPR